MDVACPGLADRISLRMNAAMQDRGLAGTSNPLLYWTRNRCTAAASTDASSVCLEYAVNATNAW